MKFETRCSERARQVFEAIEFLRKAYKEGKLLEVENFDDLLEALDSSQELEYYYSVLKGNHINI